MINFTIEWLAGFFDGEGSIGIYLRNTNKQKTKKYYVLVISLAQSGLIGEKICKTLQSIYGGSVYCQQSVNKPQWKWNISANKAADFLYVIKPYLINKKEEAELGFLFQGLLDKNEFNPEAKDFAAQLKTCKLNY